MDRSPIPRSTRRRPTDSREHLSRLAQELMGICGTAMAAFGANPGGRAQALMRRFPATASLARQILDDAVKIGRIHTHWQHDSSYVDADGHPKPIAVRGPAPSYEALCSSCRLRDPDRLLQLSCSFGLCTRVGRDRLAYRSDVPLFTGNPVLGFARAVVTVERLMRTALHNAQQRGKATDPLADRTAEVVLSEQEFRKFAAHTRRFLSSFVESSDRQLLASVARRHRSPSSRHRVSGVTAFVFRD